MEPRGNSNERRLEAVANSCLGLLVRNGLEHFPLTCIYRELLTRLIDEPSADLLTSPFIDSLTYLLISWPLLIRILACSLLHYLGSTIREHVKKRSIYIEKNHIEKELIQGADIHKKELTWEKEIHKESMMGYLVYKTIVQGSG